MLNTPLKSPQSTPKNDLIFELKNCSNLIQLTTQNEAAKMPLLREKFSVNASAIEHTRKSKF